MQERIDSLEQLKLAHLKPEDLTWIYSTGQGQTTGSGRNKQHSYRQGIQTPVGDIKLSVWIKAAEYIVERDGLQEELEHLRPYAINYGSGSILSRQVSHASLLNMCLSALYRNPAWVSFVPYNRQYHPELLNTTPIVEVVMDCCQIRCEVPTVQIHTEDRSVHCPVCGRWTSFKICESEKI